MIKIQTAKLVNDASFDNSKNLKRNKMKLIGKNILIVPQEEDTKSKGGLIMTASDVNELRYKKATVVAAGSMVDGIRPGAFIYFDAKPRVQRRTSVARQPKRNGVKFLSTLLSGSIRSFFISGLLS